jgi:hypothetical protein
MHGRTVRWFVAPATITLAACGGGGERVASTPPAPVVSPGPTAPPQAAQVTIFASPTVGEYATAGASIAGPGGNLDTYSSASDRFGTISTAASDQARIRYTPDGSYEVKLAGADWDSLIPYKGLANPAPNNNYFQPAGVPMNYGYLVTRNSREAGYLYSELAG